MMKQQFLLAFLAVIIPATFATCSEQQTKDDCLANCGCYFCTVCPKNISVCTDDVYLCELADGIYIDSSKTNYCKYSDTILLAIIVFFGVMGLIVIICLCSIDKCYCRRRPI